MPDAEVASGELPVSLYNSHESQCEGQSDQYLAGRILLIVILFNLNW